VAGAGVRAKKVRSSLRWLNCGRWLIKQSGVRFPYVLLQAVGIVRIFRGKIHLVEIPLYLGAAMVMGIKHFRFAGSGGRYGRWRLILEAGALAFSFARKDACSSCTDFAAFIAISGA